MVIGMATCKGRQKYAQKAIESLKFQADAIHLYDNTIRPDLTDNGKFWGLTLYPGEPVYYFTCDDDILYPPTYVEDTKAAIEKHGCIVAYHGRRLVGARRNYYKGGHEVFRFNGEVLQDTPIDVCGTGVTAFRTDYFNPVGIHESPYLRMSDMVFSLRAARQKKDIMVLAHPVGYLQDLGVPRHMTIYWSESQKKPNQTSLHKFADEIYQIKHQQ